VAAVFVLSIPLAFWSANAAKYFWLVLILIGPVASRLTNRADS
jgi:hypothetical protein